MSFDVEYPNRKDWRSPYHDARRTSRACRNHNSCEWCAQNRRYRLLKERERCDIELRAYRNGLLEMTEDELRYLEMESDINYESAITLALNQHTP